MNKKANIPMNFLFFIMAIAVVVMFISPIKTFVDMAQNSANLNCRGYIYNGNPNATLSFNATLNGGASGSPATCGVMSLYLPYILLVVLITGVANLLYNKVDPLQDSQ